MFIEGKMRKPTAILTGDLEWRADSPVCRTDDFIETQIKKWQWLKELQKKYNCPVLDSGDVFDQWKSPPWLEVLALKNTPDQFYTIPGNHDLPGHNIANLSRSSLAVLEAAGKATVLLAPLTVGNLVIHPFPWGTKPTALTGEKKPGFFYVAICHIMTFQGELPWPGCEDTESGRLLRMMKGYDLVLTGHNHKPFVVVGKDSRILVNPGSLMRTNADQMDHTPRVYLWYPDGGPIVNPVPVPIEQNVISRVHLDKKEERDKRMEAFVEKLNGDYEISSQFDKNLEAFFHKNKVRSSVKQLVMEAVER